MKNKLRTGLIALLSSATLDCVSPLNEDIVFLTEDLRVCFNDSYILLLDGGFGGTCWIDKDNDKIPDTKYTWAVHRAGTTRVYHEIDQIDLSFFKEKVEAAETIRRKYFKGK